MRRIAFMNQKGGVGKTTCTVNLGAALAGRERKVLLVDIDPQANLSVNLNVDIYDLPASIYSVMIGETPVAEAIVRDVLPGVDLLPANIDLTGAEIELVNAVGRETVLRGALEKHFAEDGQDEGGSYDFMLVDCPPSLGILSLNALTAVSEVFIPLQTEFFALQGMTRLIEVLDLIRDRLGHAIEITGIIPTLFDSRTRLSHEVESEIREFFGEKVFETRINKTVRLAEAPSHGKTIFDYAPGSRGAEDYAALAEEVLRRG